MKTIDLKTQQIDAVTVYQSDDIEKNMLGHEQNMNIWQAVYKTDPKFTKAFTNNGGGTSINGTYMTMQATKVFGPMGIGWGVDVLDERFDEGAPIIQSVIKDGVTTEEPIITKSGALCEVTHVIKIKFWYMLDGVRGEIISYGCTPYISKTKYGPMTDGEAPKKSLTDATKKALSQLGFSADIFLGLYDDQRYRKDNDVEFSIKNASDKAEDVVRLRKELDDKFSRNANTLSNSVSKHETNTIFTTVCREIEIHRNAAKKSGDNEYFNYLTSRITRLNEIKEKRIGELSNESH